VDSRAISSGAMTISVGRSLLLAAMRSSSTCAPRRPSRRAAGDGGERGRSVLGGLDVIEADHGNIARNGEPGILEGADGADGGDVVEAEDGGEVTGSFEKRLHGLVADLRGHGVVVVLHGPAGGIDADDQGGVDGETHGPGHFLDRFPADLRVGNGVRAAHEGDAAMAERDQMRERLLHGCRVVEDDVGDVFDRTVRGDGDHRHRHINLVGGVLRSRKPSTARSTSMRGYFSISSGFQSWQAVK